MKNTPNYTSITLKYKDIGDNSVVKNYLTTEGDERN